MRKCRKYNTPVKGFLDDLDQAPKKVQTAAMRAIMGKIPRVTIYDRVAAKVASQFRGFGKGRGQANSPLTHWLKHEEPVFALGVKVHEVVKATIIEYKKELRRMEKARQARLLKPNRRMMRAARRYRKSVMGLPDHKAA